MNRRRGKWAGLAGRKWDLISLRFACLWLARAPLPACRRMVLVWRFHLKQNPLISVVAPSIKKSFFVCFFGWKHPVLLLCPLVALVCPTIHFSQVILFWLWCAAVITATAVSISIFSLWCHMMSCRLQLIDDLSYEDVKKCYRGSVSPAPHMLAHACFPGNHIPPATSCFEDNLELCWRSDLRRWRSSASLLLPPRSLVSLLCGVRR